MAVFLARMVIPFSRSSGLESMIREPTSWFSRKVWLCFSSASTSVVLPWSTWAMIARLRTSWRRLVVISLSFASPKRKPRAAEPRGASGNVSGVLGDPDALRARALGARLDLEGDLLAAVQAVEVALGAAAVEEVLLPVLGRDEAEATVGDELLDGS